MSRQADTWRRVTTRAEFCALFADRPLVGPAGLRFTIRADGRLSGRVDGQAFEGKWTWQDGFFCRVLSGDRGQAPHDCEVIETDGTRLRYVRNKGAGEVVTVSTA